MHENEILSANLHNSKSMIPCVCFLNYGSCYQPKPWNSFSTVRIKKHWAVRVLDRVYFWLFSMKLVRQNRSSEVLSKEQQTKMTDYDFEHLVQVEPLIRFRVILFVIRLFISSYRPRGGISASLVCLDPIKSS